MAFTAPTPCGLHPATQRAWCTPYPRWLNCPRRSAPPVLAVIANLGRLRTAPTGGNCSAVSVATSLFNGVLWHRNSITGPGRCRCRRRRPRRFRTPGPISLLIDAMLPSGQRTCAMPQRDRSGWPAEGTSDSSLGFTVLGARVSLFVQEHRADDVNGTIRSASGADLERCTSAKFGLTGNRSQARCGSIFETRRGTPDAAQIGSVAVHWPVG